MAFKKKGGKGKLEKPIGAFWKRMSGKGKKFYSGVLEGPLEVSLDDGEKMNIVMFKNTFKEKENQPDFKIYVSKDTDEYKGKKRGRKGKPVKHNKHEDDDEEEDEDLDDEDEDSDEDEDEDEDTDDEDEDTDDDDDEDEDTDDDDDEDDGKKKKKGLNRKKGKKSKDDDDDEDEDEDDEDDDS